MDKIHKVFMVMFDHRWKNHGWFSPLFSFLIFKFQHYVCITFTLKNLSWGFWLLCMDNCKMSSLSSVSALGHLPRYNWCWLITTQTTLDSFPSLIKIMWMSPHCLSHNLPSPLANMEDPSQPLTYPEDEFPYSLPIV